MINTISLGQPSENIYIIPSYQQDTHSSLSVHPDAIEEFQQQNLIPPVHPTAFYYRPPNDFCHYYVDCKEISYDAVIYLLNKSSRTNDVLPNENKCVIYYHQ